MKSIVESFTCGLDDFEAEVQKIIDKYGDEIVSVSTISYGEYNDGKFVPTWYAACKLLIIVKDVLKI